MEWRPCTVVLLHCCAPAAAPLYCCATCTVVPGRFRAGGLAWEWRSDSGDIDGFDYISAELIR